MIMKKSGKKILVLLLCISLTFPAMAAETADAAISPESSTETVSLAAAETEAPASAESKTDPPTSADSETDPPASADSETDPPASTDSETTPPASADSEAEAPSAEKEILTEEQTTELIEQITSANVVIQKASCTAFGEIDIQWDAVTEPEPDGYLVYRKTAGSTWVRLGIVSDTTYKDTSAVYGTKYYYTVRAYKYINDRNYLGQYDRTGVLCEACPAAPVIKSQNIDAASARLIWNEIPGTDYYKVYVLDSATSKWKSIATVTALEYTVSVSCGHKYTYTVRAYKKNGNQTLSSYYDKKGATVQTVPDTPVLKEAKSTKANRIDISWASANGATKYRLYRKKNGEKNFSLLAVVSGSKYTDTNVSCGDTYIYTVKACVIVGNQQICSNYDHTGVSASPLPPTPELKTLSLNGSENLVVNWNKAAGADGYIVYRKTEGSSWSRLASIAGGDKTSFTDTSADGQTAYIYTVRAYCYVNGKNILSDYDKEGEQARTQAGWRQYVAQTAIQYLGADEYSAGHREIIALYNSQKPLPRNVTMQLSYDWCAAFGTAIAVKCNLLDIIPGECSCNCQIALWKAKNRWQENDAYVPNVGDYIYYDWEDSGKGDNVGQADHVGIVVSVQNGIIKVIEGNKGDTVAYRELKINGRYIRGYGLPNYASKATLK